MEEPMNIDRTFNFLKEKKRIKEPVAKLGPIRKKRKIKFGVLKGKIKSAKDFDALLKICSPL